MMVNAVVTVVTLCESRRTCDHEEEQCYCKIFLHGPNPTTILRRVGAPKVCRIKTDNGTAKGRSAGDQPGRDFLAEFKFGVN